MSELKSRKNLTTTYMVCGTDGKGITVTAAKEQPVVDLIPGIPMVIPVDAHGCRILANGEIVREGNNGENLGKVQNPGVAAKLKRAIEQKEGTTR